MSKSLSSLMACGTKLWLDSIDPDLVLSNREQGATGATSNPIIVADLLKTGRFDDDIERLIDAGKEDVDIAWAMTDLLVTSAQQVFLPVWEATGGDDGYVSFELDPLLEDEQTAPPHEQRVARYIELAQHWATGHRNRMIKVPATPAGLDALEDIAAAGIPLNVTLIFSLRQYKAAQQAIWRGAQRRDDLTEFKSVYSIFVSRLDVYSEQHLPQLSSEAQGLVGIVNAKRMWQENETFWKDHPTPLRQEMVFASTGTKKPTDPPWKYVEALAGSDIQTNPPATNQAVADSGREFVRQVDQLPTPTVLEEIDREVDFAKLEEVLMEEGLKKFADPQKALIELIQSKRTALSK